ncbi:MAG: sulfite exporter TauE/SafE family protein [Bacteroidota bacterium]
MDITWYHYLIAIVGSAIAGSINTLAGNGSAITLTILTELLGLPGNMANGTNRVGVLTQCAASTYAFHRNGKLDLQRGRLPIVLITLGAIAGVIVAVWVSSEQFKQVFRFLLVVMLFFILIKPKRWLRATDTSKAPSLWLMIPIFLGLGFYGGFIQMGMGVFFLAAMVLVARYSIMDSNVIKSAVVGLYTIVVLAIFAWQGLVDWRIGGIMAIGQTTGGYLTAHYASRFPQANLWAHRVLVVVVIGAILKLFDVHTLLL